MDTNSERAAAPLTDAGRLFIEQNTIFAALAAEEEELMAPIRARIEELRLERLATRDGFAEKIGAAIDGISFEDLLDPFRAMELYEASWNLGYGVPQRRDAYRALFADCYIFSVETYGYGEGNQLTYMAPRLGIPKDKDEAMLARTAEKVEAVHRTNMEIIGDLDIAKISTFSDAEDDSYYESYYITFNSETDEWELAGRYGRPIAQSAELIDVLRKAPTYG